MTKPPSCPEGPNCPRDLNCPEQAPLLRAELFHAQHNASGHNLRVLEGATHDFGSSMAQLSTSINDWFEGARRLTADDISRWEGHRHEESQMRRKDSGDSAKDKDGWAAQSEARGSATKHDAKHDAKQEDPDEDDDLFVMV